MSFFLPPSPYPPDRYHGEGEVNVLSRTVNREPDISGDGTTCHFLVTGADTDGEFGLYQWYLGPRTGGPKPHIHKALSESFFVSSGSLTLHDGERWRDASAGEFVYVPPGGIHGFRNDHDDPVTMLLLFAPGAPRERYFEGVQYLSGNATPPSSQELAEFFRQHDTYWVDVP